MTGPELQTLHTRLRERIGALVREGPPAPGEVRPGRIVGDVTRVFLELSSEADGKGLWSLEFVFDEDDSRVARLEARFGDGIEASRRGVELRGYAVHLLLPKMLPKNTFDGKSASEHLHTVPSDEKSLIARFVRALDELGAYRFIEPLALESVETELF